MSDSEFLDDESLDDDLAGRVATYFATMDVPPPPLPAEASARIEALVASQAASSRRGRVSWTLPRRQVLRGAAVSALIAVLAILMIPWVQVQPLSAMERMALQLREVTSYRYHLSSTTTRSVEPGRQVTTFQEEGDVYWQTPDAFRFEDKIVKREIPVADGGRPEEMLENFVEVFSASKPGLLIDHKRQTFLREGFAPIGSATYPWQPLKMIRDGQGHIVRELGVRDIGGKPARGYVTRFESGDPPRSHDWHVWVDPATDLPLEIGYSVDDKKEHGTMTVLRVTDFRWNLPLDPSLFEATVPDGYRETTSTPADPK